MKESVYSVFGILSFCALIAAVFFAIKAYKGKDRGKRALTSLHIFTLGVFISTVVIFIPVYYVGYDFGDSYTVVRPFLISIHHAFRVFILDGEFDTIRNAVEGVGTIPHVLFSVYAGLLYVLAPILTFSNVLSLFKNVKNEIRFSWYKRRPFYVFSELNEKSITLAESIVNDNEDKSSNDTKSIAKEDKVADNTKKMKPVIVFTDVFEQDEEDDYELLLRAHDIRAILLKKDITRLNTKRKKSYIEFFLIGDNESENTEQAIKLTNINIDSIKRAVYLFSAKQSSGYVLDSLYKGKCVLSEKLEKKIVEDAAGVLYKNTLSAEDFDFEDSFYLRRIDNIALLPINVLSDRSTVSAVSKAIIGEETKRISLMIIGTGEYGKAFLKTALWLYQQLGYLVEISVLDKEEKNIIVGRIEKDCPDLLFDNEVSTNGDSNYHIRIVSKVDVDSAELGNLFASENDREWIKRTQLAIVSLGDDDKNIETAVTLRKLFDQINEIDNQSDCLKDNDEMPLIYSIVYNEKKASNLTGVDGQGIKNYRGKSYHIRFVGSLKDQYSYAVIKKMKDVEKEAVGNHLEWAGQISRLRDIYENPSDNDNSIILEFRKKAHAFFKEKSLKAKENDKEYVYTEEWGDEFLFNKDKDGKADYSRIITDEVKRSIIGYMNYEYYRNSSIAKAVYADVYKAFCGTQSFDEKHDDKTGICMCKNCEKKRISEHMRWNAYMRTIGYKAGKIRSDRGQIHPDLIPWDELPLFERYKD